MSQYFNQAKMSLAPFIQQQLREGREQGAQWMIRMKNTLTGEIFPLYVGDGRSPRQEFSNYVTRNGPNFDPIECYDFSKNLQDQVSDDICQNWDKQLPVQTGNFTGVVPFTGVGPNMPPDDPDSQR